MKLIWLILIIGALMLYFCAGILLQASLWIIAGVGTYIVLRLIVNIVNHKDLLEGIGWRA